MITPPTHALLPYLHAAGKHAVRIMHTFTPQSVSNMLWAYATLEQCPDAAFLQVAPGTFCCLCNAAFAPLLD